MRSRPAHPISGHILRYWSIDSGRSIGGLQRPSPALPYTERADGGKLLRLASVLTRIKSELKRRVR